MKTNGERALFLLALLFLCLGFVRRGLSWQEHSPNTQSFQGHDSGLVGIITEYRPWSLSWHCTTPSTITIQVNSETGTLLRTVSCRTLPDSIDITLTGTLYLAVTGHGDWTIITD